MSTWPTTRGKRATEFPFASAHPVRAGDHLKTAKTVRIEIPPTLLALADEVRMKRREFIVQFC